MSQRHQLGPDQRRVRNRELIDRLAAAGPRDREKVLEELVLANLEVARSIARRYAGRSKIGSDLEQVAYLALVQSARDFDVSRGREFLAYAIPCMAGAVKHHFRDFAWVVKPPRDVQ